MPYQIVLSNGSVLTNLADNTVDTSTSLSLVGRNYPGYGGLIATNFVRLLENSADSAAPPRPLVGQFWYDTANSVIKVCQVAGDDPVWFALTTGVSSVAGRTGAITLLQLVSSGLAPLASPALTGVPTAPTADASTSSTQLATTAFVQTRIGQLVSGVSSVVGATGAVTLAKLTSGGVAPLGSPALTGVPTAPTAAPNTSTKQIATTEFVFKQVGALTSGVSSVVGFGGAVTITQLVTGGVAPLTSPALTGTPTSPTAAVGTNTNQIASTAFVNATIASLIPATRIRLNGNLTVYCAANGSDTTGTGTSTAPFRNITTAFHHIFTRYDGNSYTATIQLGAGTYETNNNIVELTGFLGLSIVGNVDNPNSVQVIVTSGNAFTINGGEVGVNGFTVMAAGTNSSTGQSGNAFLITNKGYLIVGTGMVFHTCGGCHMLCQENSTVSVGHPYVVSGNAQAHIWSTLSSQIVYNGKLYGSAAATILGNLTFWDGFVVCTFNSSMNFQNYTFNYNDAVEGMKYHANTYGLINTNGAGGNYFPGNGGAALSTGGLYL